MGTRVRFAYVWQAKDFKSNDFGCVAGKGVTDVFFGCVANEGLREMVGGAVCLTVVAGG